MVVKFLVILKINYLFMFLFIFKEVIIILNKDIFEFFWNVKCDKIKCVVVI